MSEADPQPRVDAEHPWPALLSFREDDQQFFGGREEEVEALFRRIAASRLTLLFGLSGLGKSSLLRAGLFPRLRREHYFPVYIRLRYGRDQVAPLTQIQEQILAQARASGIDAPQPQPGEGVWEYFHRPDADFWDARNHPTTPVLVFDQFEELFTKGREVPDEANDLVEELANLAEGASPALMRDAAEKDRSLLRQVFEDRYRLVIGIRSDYLAQLQGISDRVRAVFANRYELRRMSGEAALKSTLTAGGQLMGEDVARRVVRFVAGAKESDGAQTVEGLDVEPALLSLVCSELNAKRIAVGAPEITASMLSGNKDEILSRFYEKSFADVAPELRVLVEDKLVTRDGKSRNFISEQTARETPGVTDEDLAKLVHRRLLRFEESGSSRRMELTHDLLTTVAAASRATREHRMQIEDAQRAQAEAERREEAARHALRRSRAAMLVFFVLLAAAVVGPFIAARWTARGAKRVEADFLWGLALEKLASDEPAEGLGYLARVIRLDRGNTAARTLLYQQLVTRAWPVPLRAFGPQGRIAATAFSADGARVAFRTGQVVEIWDVASGRLVARTDLGFEPRNMQFAGDGWTLLFNTRLAAPELSRVLDDRPVFWNVKTGRMMTPGDLRKAPGVPQCSDLRVLDLSADGRELAVGCHSALAILPMGGEHPADRWLMEPRADNLLSSRFAPDPNFLIVNEGIFDRRGAGSLARTIDAVAGESWGDFSADGKQIAILNRSRSTIEVREVESWRVVAGPFDNQSKPRSAVFDRTGSTIMTTADDRRIRVLDRTYGLLFELPAAGSFAFSPDGARVLTGSDRVIRWWSVHRGTPLSEPLVQPKTIAAHPHPGGNMVTVSTAARVWQLASAVLPPALAESGKAGDDPPLDFSADRKTAVFRDDRGSLTGFDAASGRRRWTSPPHASFEAIDPTASRGVVVDDRGAMSLVDTGTWKPRWTLSKPVSDLQGCTFSADGKVIVLDAARFDGDTTTGTVLLDAATGKRLAPPIDGTSQAFLAMSHDGALLAFRRTAETVVWNVSARRAVLSIPVKEDAARGEIGFSPDGRQLAEWTPDALRVWNLASGSARAAKLEDEESVAGVSFSPDGRLLAMMSANGVALCDSQTLDCRATGILAHPGVYALEFSLDGTRVLTATDNDIRVWDVASRRPVTLPMPWQTFAGLSPDGTTLFAVMNGELYRVPLPSIDDADAALLADLGEALAGVRVERLGVIAPLEGATALAALEKRCQETRGRACDLVRWLRAAPEKRTISPISSLGAAEYIERRRHLNAADDEWWRLKALFPNEPAVGRKPGA